MEHTHEWLVIHPEEDENPKVQNIRRSKSLWPATRGMIVWANNRQEAMERGREVLMQEDPLFKMEQFEEEQWVIRELAPGEKVAALWMAGVNDVPYSKSPYKLDEKKPESEADFEDYYDAATSGKGHTSSKNSSKRG